MIYKVFTVHDAAVGAYLQPFFARSEGEALRNFMSAAQNEKHQFFANAKDFTLFYLADFDDQTGEFHPLKVHKSLGKAIDYKSTE